MAAPFLADKSSDSTHLLDDFAASALRIADHETPPGTSPTFARMSIPATEEITAEVEGAASWLGLATDEILLAALGRAIARTIGEGVVIVDVTGERRWLLHAIPLRCASSQQASPTEMLSGVHKAMGVPPRQGYRSEIFFNDVGTLPDGTTPTYETPPGLGYALELRVYRTNGLLHLDWWYDTGRFDHYTVEELSEQFPLALFEMTSDAAAPV